MPIFNGDIHFNKVKNEWAAGKPLLHFKLYENVFYAREYIVLLYYI